MNRDHFQTVGLRRCSRLASLLAIALLALCATAALAADETTDGVAAPGGVTVEKVQAKIRRVEASADMDPALKPKVIDLYKQTLEQLKTADEWSARAASWETKHSKDQEELTSKRAQLDKAPAEIVPNISSTATLEELEHNLPKFELDLKTAQQELARRETEPKRRRAELPQLLSAGQKRMKEVDQELSTLALAPDSIDLPEARREFLVALKLAIEREVAAYEIERLWYEANPDLITVQQDVAALEVRQAEATAKRCRELLNLRRQQEASSQAAEAGRARAAVEAHPELQALADKNAELTAQQNGPDGFPARLAKMTKEIEELNGELSRLTSQYTKVRNRIAASGLTDSIGLLLQKHRNDLPDVSGHRQRIRARQAEIALVRASLIELEDQRAELANLEPHVRRVMENVNLESRPGQQHAVEAALRELLKARQGYLESQIADANTYINGLVIDLDVAERSLVAEIEDYTQFINERILWIRSAPPLAIADAQRAWDGLLKLIDWDHWNVVAANLGNDARENPGIYVIAGMLFVPLLFCQSRFRRRIYLIDRQTTHAYAADIRPTLEALVLTALIAVVWPGVLALLAWRIAAPADASLHAQTIAYGLRVTAAVFLSMELLRQICRPKGVGEAHFGWPREGVSLVAKNLRWAMLLGLPTTFIVAVVEAPEIDFHRSSLGRLAFVVGLATITVFAHRMLHPKHGLLTQIEKTGNAWLWGQTRAWHLLAIGVPLSLAGVAALGYFYTALHLTWRLQSSMWLLVGLLLVHAFALRWLLIARRKLAIKQARDRRAAALAQSQQIQTRSGEMHAHAAHASMLTSTGVMAAVPVDLGTIDLQTRRLLRSGIMMAVVVGSWLIWIDILPALGVLDRCQLWQYNTDVNEMIVTGEGQKTTTISGTAYVTLSDVLVAGVILLMTTIAGRNLPGLLEIAFLQRLPLDPGGRYAVTTISRYVITLVGLAAAFWMIGVSWSNVKWLAAAMTVGLGFGLQEIFANFVSGLIILFERPLRVGDTVTVGGVSGTVTRIRIRATTITDWDRKELIVPNREFITGQLINWTLSDSILRLVVKVGVAYGSDVSLVHALLLQVAQEEPRVLREPPPTAIFNQIADSPFDFELRVYVAGLDEYQTLRHELNTRIEQLMREHGVELSFPQRAIAAKPVEHVAGVLPRVTHQHKLAS